MMTYLVQDILDMAQINSNKFRKNITKFKVKNTIQKAMAMHQYKADANGIQLI